MGKSFPSQQKMSSILIVQVSVTQFVGEQINSQLWASGEQKKAWTCIFAWYAEALIQENLKTITIHIEATKKEYQPWEKVKLKIQTTDHKGKAVTARVSLSVVDKALSDLYDLIKEPIPYFYNRLGSSIGNFGNRKKSLLCFEDLLCWWWKRWRWSRWKLKEPQKEVLWPRFLECGKSLPQEGKLNLNLICLIISRLGW